MQLKLLLALTFAILATVLLPAQQNTYTKQKVSETDIQLLLGYYGQDGNHSAVTGGTGTEKLSVYSASMNVLQRFDSTHSITFDAGIDFITSASTDKIDFFMSSASYNDYHFYFGGGYSYNIKKAGLEVGAGATVSAESDYFSSGFSVFANHTNRAGTRTLSIRFQALFDDLRWGRINPGVHRPDKLIYPQELRGINWFTNYRRNSYNLLLGYSQDINTRLRVAVYPGVVFQEGLLSTPFHRVYFNDSLTLKVENLPQFRVRVPVGAQLTAFVGKRLVLRNALRFYWDNFGIWSGTAEVETPIKVTARYTLAPFVRFYYQTASTYFAPYRQHAVTEAYYTSDYDLSEHYSYKVGLGNSYVFNSYFKLALRYAYYHRSDRLYAHMVSLLLSYHKKATRDALLKKP